ncbi:hypothetical protein [Cyanobium gracile]|uniref:Uncharacterized protein n=1 Tax=Cyanobium gracile UHCC 0281 TaxID=3110309 RepID=A0ABU5SWR0_9CYAN|nr:hypothetical protein [Cyanobium gracile]MEA5442965.1 hypothetical protein [Cyanobium gracile UHCC 0281]
MAPLPALLIALGVPLLLLLGFTLLLEQRRGHLPGWLAALSGRDALLWNIGVGLLIGLSLLRVLLGR